LNSKDEYFKNKPRKERYLQCTKINKSPNNSQLETPRNNRTIYPLPLNIDPTPPTTSNKNNDVHLNVDVTNVLAKVIVHIPLSELIKIPSQMDKVKKVLDC